MHKTNLSFIFLKWYKNFQSYIGILIKSNFYKVVKSIVCINIGYLIDFP